MSLFVGKRGLKHQYAEILHNDAALVVANSLANSVLFMTLDGTKYKFFIDNLLNQEIVIHLEHPEAYKETDYAANFLQYRLLFTKVAGGQTLNYTVGESPQVQFDPGTKVWIYHSASPGNGKFKINAW